MKRWMSIGTVLMVASVLVRAAETNNAQSFFAIQDIPSDNQIGTIFDPVPPQSLHPVYERIYHALRQEGILQSLGGVHQSTLVALDGTWYQSSQKIHCPCCSCLEHAKGQTTCYHRPITPVIVAPNRSELLTLRPELITAPDGHTKQDCQIAAANRWVQQNVSEACASERRGVLGWYRCVVPLGRCCTTASLTGGCYTATRSETPFASAKEIGYNPIIKTA